MTMNMCILMNMNIYITPHNEKKLRQEKSMSGLVNQLLEKYYKDTEDRTAPPNPVIKVGTYTVKPQPPVLNILEYPEDAPQSVAIKPDIQKSVADATEVRTAKMGNHTYIMNGKDPLRKMNDETGEVETWKEVDKKETPACCKQKTPCRHWSFDGHREAWVNQLTGEVKEIA